MSLSSEPRSGLVVASVALLILIVFVVVATTVAFRSNAQQETISSKARTDATVTAIEDRMVAYTEVLYGTRSWFSDGLPTRGEYHRIIGELELDSRYEGVQVIGAAHLVDRADLAVWQRETQLATTQSGLPYPTFEVYPRPNLDSVLSIDFIEPQQGNEQAFGLDFFSESNRREAAQRARDTGEPSSTAPITLVQETGEQRAILVMVPFYRPELPIQTVGERRFAFDGVVYAAFRMGDLLSGVLGENEHSVVDVTDLASGDSLFATSSVATLGQAARPDHEGRLDVAGRQWSVVVDDEQTSLSTMERFLPAIIFFGGLFIAALIAGLLRSIASARSNATALAREMTKELEAITEAAAEAIVAVNDAGTIVAWNRGATDIFRANPDEMLGRSVLDLVPDRFWGAFRDQLGELFDLSNDQLFDAPVHLTARRVDGEEFPLELSISRWTAHGTVFMTGFARDITDRLEAEQALVQTTDMLVAVLGAATEMSVVATDLEGTITLFNEGAERMLGYSSDDLVGLASPAVFHDAAEVAARAAELGISPGFDAFVRIAREHGSETRTWTYVRQDGSRLPVELTVTPIRDHTGSHVGFMGVGVDITKRIRSEHAQQDALDRQQEIVVKLTELDRVKSDFVSTTSHELRTPLTSIIGFSELLEDRYQRNANEGDGKLVQMIARNAERLLLLVEDLLSLSHIESGAFRLHRETGDCVPLVEAACEAVGPLASARSIKVVRDLSGRLPVEADRPQLERVFLNLLSNAVKFSHDGDLVEVVALREADEVVVSISDHGIGIPANEQGQVFTRFFRSRNAEERSINGSGLGLAIVANIVDRHDGRVDITSVEGIGTTVTVRLPAASLTDENTRLQEVLT